MQKVGFIILKVYDDSTTTYYLEIASVNPSKLCVGTFSFYFNET